ncbi:type IV secretion system protein VirB10 [Caulobacter sp. DWP3-1-3b2]|uniref:type IV secretion system protein VirB10 n=1 Tax=Caulobacter sp. DWP3-1-3b2 TaxID=2804643 RepID=UPI003CF4CD8F
MVDARDPRPLPSDQEPPIDIGESLRPAVAGAESKNGLWLALGVAAILAIVMFVWLSAQRADRTRLANAQLGAAGVSTVATIDSAPPPALLVAETAGRDALLPPPPPLLPDTSAIPTPVAAAYNAVPVIIGSPPPAPRIDPGVHRRAPALIVDLAEGPAGGAGNTTLTGLAAAAQVKPGGPTGPALNGDEAFAQRVGAIEPESAQATMLRNPQSVVPQGAMIPAVLETALSSDLPGFTRAVVSRDVRSFDGSTVLIPRGSRVIGQYRSGLAQGQSRAFVIWTRILRPDGASIQIASSGADALGRAGMDGQVDRHFFQRFGGAILLSVVNGAVAGLSERASTQIVIGSSQDAASLGALAQPANISPTIKVPQGSPIRIFVARDLDFSPVGGVR